MIEVEAKFQLTDPEQFEQLVVQKLGGHLVGVEHQSDEYFNHPCRDFEQTDEALRIRVTSHSEQPQQPDSVQLCYKGPRLDQATKTRTELEHLAATGDSTDTGDSKLRAALLRQILVALGFSSAGCVNKTRRSLAVRFEDRDAVVAIDMVEGLSPFAELEIQCDEAERPQATELILRLAQFLDLHHTERRSYLELLERRH